MRYFLIAGERSGDLHGSFLVQYLFRHDPQATIVAWGGDYMQKAGATILKNYRELAIMGFWEVLKNIRRLSKLQRQCKSEIVSFNPDAVIFIDFPGFNLRIAEFTKTKGFKNFYYISPKVWAWNQKRAFKIKRVVDQLFCILPFEKSFFQDYGMEVTYVGNPLKESIKTYDYDQSFIKSLEGKRVVAILPGSRQQEVSAMLGLVQQLANRNAALHFVVAGVDNLPVELYKQFEAEVLNLTVVFGKTYEILKAAQAAIVTSGTATLEAALLKTPQVVVYRTSPVSYALARRLIKVPFISLVNLIAGREVVRELIQHDMSPEKVGQELELILSDDKKRKQILSGYAEIDRLIGDQNAPEQTAMAIVRQLRG